MLKSNRFAPQLESLDQRALMNCTVTGVAGHINVTGDSGNDQVTIRDNGHGNVTVVATGAGVKTFSGITSITVNTEDGNDTVTYTLHGNLVGKQYLIVGLGSENGVNGGGDDRFQAKLANGIDIVNGGRLDILANGGGGTDVLNVTAIGVDVQAGGVLKSQVGGGKGNDTINQYFDGEGDGTVTMRSAGGANADSIVQSMKFAPGSTGATAGWVRGDDGNDSLSYFLWTQPGVTVVQADLLGGAGVDGLMFTPNINVVP